MLMNFKYQHHELLGTYKFPNSAFENLNLFDCDVIVKKTLNRNFSMTDQFELIKRENSDHFSKEK